MRYNPIASMIQLGADKRIVDALMSRTTGCVVGSVGGHQVRLIFRNGKAVSIMTNKDASDFADAIRSHVGAPKCEIRILGS
jgi:hypothetical protein